MSGVLLQREAEALEHLDVSPTILRKRDRSLSQKRTVRWMKMIL